MQTLNANGGVTDDDFSSFFKKTANINIYSFRKPYRHNALFRLTDEEIRSINCGLRPLQIASYTTLPSEMDGGMNGWEYELPISGTPHRKNDFRGYYPKAEPMIRNFSVPSKVSTQSNSVIASAVVTLMNGLNVSLADLVKLKNCHAAVYVKKSSSNLSDMFYNENATINDGGTFDVDINPSSLSVGTWTAYPFLLDNSDGLAYYTIPNVSPVTFEVVSSLDSLGIIAQYRYNTNGSIAAVQFKFTLTQNSNGSTSNNYVCLSATKDDITPETGKGEYGMSLPNFSVLSGQTYNFPYDYNGNEWYEISANNFNPTSVLWLVVSIGSGRLIESTNIMQTVDPRL